MLVRSRDSRVSEHNSSRASIHNEHTELNINQAFRNVLLCILCSARFQKGMKKSCVLGKYLGIQKMI